MTILGKILVIVNLVLSVVAFALIVFVYAAKTNWKALADRYDKELKVSQQNADTYKEEIDRVRDETAAKVTEFDRQLKETVKERDAQRAEAENYQKRYAKAVDQGKDVDSSRDSITAELARRKAEIDQLNGILASRDKRLLDIEKEKRDLRDRAVSAEIASKAEQERNMQLVAQLEKLEKDRQRPAPGARPSAVTRMPPAEPVEGLVTEVDPQTGFLKLSIGSDAGLARDNTLEVYRLNPPRYLGLVRIVEVQSNESIARPVAGSQGRTPIQVGDRVASEIAVRR